MTGMAKLSALSVVTAHCGTRAVSSPPLPRDSRSDWSDVYQSVSSTEASDSGSWEKDKQQVLP